MITKISQYRQPWEGTIINTPFQNVRKSEVKHNNTTFHKVQTSEGTHSNTTVYKVQTKYEGTHTNTTHVLQERIQKRERGSYNKSYLIIRLEEILSDPPIPISALPFQFELSDAAATTNYDVLQENHFDLHKVLMDHPLAPISIGSEFRPIDQLEWILDNHPNWKLIQETISDRTEHHITTTKDKTHITDLRHRLSKGNHKSASGKRAAILAPKLDKEVEKG